ncbi:MAG: hypothetical protein MUR51_02120 [Pseudomonadota bacterium]|nr:hypothetical protein [Pseudomonadota bacterium]
MQHRLNISLTRILMALRFEAIVGEGDVDSYTVGLNWFATPKFTFQCKLC